MDKTIAVFMKYRFLLMNLVSRDIKVKYRRSVLGMLWSVLNPLLMMLVMTAVFSQFFRFAIPNFPVYYLSASLLWNFFSESTSVSMSAITGNAALIKKVYIPKYIFPLQKVLSSCVNMGFSCIALIFIV
ncbi:MAG TPA: ABC transporter permease, partial [Candidatus Egerieicola faecale]|nr:ABC transporter permease [Candidatus Egerieicola faecale]